ncbi:DEKNAAC105619 [Brettanomyces naardenensis]|uniref:Mannosyl-oligosaccharide glucosidase n=1 Tax=Brettanomyces naardenensis TaxID=13370 RepID=A0A448YU38_BRENA|nr:DEKNAAC105619 [Brettanomyces naardenensis]
MLKISGWIWYLALLGLISTAWTIKYEAMDETDPDLDDRFEKANEKSLLWGPYRPNLYLGIRSRLPESLIAGLVWFRADDYSSVGDARHQCDSRDDMETFGWMDYDPRAGGSESIEDTKMGLSLKADFVKTGGGENWGLRVQGTAKDKNAITSLVFYAGTEGKDNALIIRSEKDTPELVHGHEVSFFGYSESLGGPFLLNVTEGRKSRHPKHGVLKDKALDPSKTHHVSLIVPDDNLWKAKDIFFVLLKENMNSIHDVEELKTIPPQEILQLKNPGLNDGNLHLVQKTFKGNFEIVVTFNMMETDDQITVDNFSSRKDSALKRLREKFNRKFQLERPFNKGKYITFAKEILSQLMGGIGYFYGDQLVDRLTNLDEVNTQLDGKPEGPHNLFSCVPSRTFFPRGFYWDEGFQLMPILQYDSDLALDIIKSWFSLIDGSGWIAREQILGEEARSGVPDEFVVQNPNIANPPTMMMIFSQLLHLANHREQFVPTDDFADKFTLNWDGGDGDDTLGDVHLTNPDVLNSYAADIYPKLQLHYEWFRSTQRGDTLGRRCKNLEEIYRWKGRDEDHCLPSGLDDYPRCSADTAELDVDLLSWMGVMTRSMAAIAKLLDETEDAELYSQRLGDIKANLEDLHWSSENQTYCDVTVNDDEEDIFECHLGYVSLMPFVHRLISPDSPHLIHILNDIRNPEKLWTDYGIRSLSKQDEYFHEGEDYWRGHIWVNMNYLILDALYYYGKRPNSTPEVKSLTNEIYTKLRENVVENVYREYRRTGYAWEQYNEETGEGQRTKNFLGWTSLVVLMMKMPESLV